ncbi:hybrid sensor histidine kinase/response regulator [Limnobacter parvus]|uniref:histidine kinase n=1 Tax=Limnobacter parvus TaxID=2939690 RepID=A0ABT1XE57_9BURK|nr:ATP-binding protein [Limnobacter parvus]MCR2745566.1 ATP-binding protein [Limnobacter parvus]
MKKLIQVIQTIGLGTQLLVLGIGALLFLATAFTVFNTIHQRAELEKVFTRQAEALAFNLAVSSSSYILEKDFSLIETLLLKTERFSELFSATVTDTAGNVLAQITRDPLSGQLIARYDVDRMVVSDSFYDQAHRSSTVYRSEEFLTVLQPVDAGQFVGLVVLDFDLTELQAKQWDSVKRNLILALVLIFPATLALGIFVRKIVVELHALTRFAKEIVGNHGATNNQTFGSKELQTLHQSLSWASVTLLSKSDALEQEKLKAINSNELKSQFLANMSHEIRTPLTGILGLTEVILDSDNVPDNTRQDLRLIQLSADHLLRVVNDILDFSKIEANCIDIESYDFHLREQVKALVRIVSGSYGKPDVKVRCEIAEDVPDILVGDCARIMQVLNNLLSNSLKFTEVGEVCLFISRANPEGIHFRVRDTGIGIAQNLQSSIFKAFSQAEPGTARKYGGTGLGLTITQRLLKLMGSDIHLWSHEGKGSEFSFTLNLATSEQNSVAKTNQMDCAIRESLADHLERFGQASRLVRVLVAEDNLVNQTFVSHVLTQLGVVHRFADDGMKAVLAVDEEQFDLVFMDMHMPVMGGLEACKRILSKPEHRRLPIVGLTADAVADTRQACQEAGMVDYITKPFKRADIEQILSKLNLKVSPIPMKNFDFDKEVLKSKVEELNEDLPLLTESLHISIKNKNWVDTKIFLYILIEHCRRFGEDDFEAFLVQLKSEMDQSIEPSAKALAHLQDNLTALRSRFVALSV